MSRQTQDAQQATQAKAQVAYSAAQRAKANTPAAKAKSITKAKRAEQAAAVSNTAILAARKVTTPATKALKVGSGALVGVAQGAMDGQPHTRMAVEQARKRAGVETREAEANATIANLEREAKANPTMVAGVSFPTAKAAATRRAKVIESLRHVGTLPKPTAPPKAKVAKVAAAKAPAADANKKIIVVAKANPYRPTTKAYVTFELFRTCKTVGQAREAAEKAGGSGANGKYDIGYLRYASRDGHIKFA